MKDKLIALIVKFVFTFAAAWLSFGYIGGNALGWIILTALAVAILTYFISDLIILPSFGNIVASIVDGLLGTLTAFLINLLAGGIKSNNQIANVFRTNLFTLAFFAVVIAVIEYFFHKYLLQSNKVSSKKDYYK
jgi:Na+/phosphate symporter